MVAEGRGSAHGWRNRAIIGRWDGRRTSPSADSILAVISWQLAPLTPRTRSSTRPSAWMINSSSCREGVGALSASARAHIRAAH